VCIFYHSKKEGQMKNSCIRNGNLFSREDAAKYLGICLTTLGRLDISQTRIRRRVFYRKDILDAWIEKKTAPRGIK
jgi:hypothetical protein